MISDELDRWILDLRAGKNRLDPLTPYAFLREEEAGVPTAAIFLTNRECPYRCLMCDLWKNTLESTVPPGAVADQIEYALEHMPEFPAKSQIKLYNSGSFFDPGAIPPDDYAPVARLINRFDRVIVESHPAFLLGKTGEDALRFRDLIGGRLEVAIGLETVHRPTLEKLNKRMTVEMFERASEFLRNNEIDLRVFILLKPPFMNEEEGIHWTLKSIDAAIDCGARICSIIPTRGGNGAMEALGESFAPPELSSLERVVEYGIDLNRSLVMADLWDIEKFYTCECSPQRASRLAVMNSSQTAPEPIDCPLCFLEFEEF